MLILQIAVGIVLGAIVLAFLPYILAGAAYIGIAALFLFLINSFPEAAGWISAILLISGIAYGFWVITRDKAWGEVGRFVGKGLLHVLWFVLIAVGLIWLFESPVLAIAPLSFGIAILAGVVRHNRRHHNFLI
jgi:hypothetical protein